MPSYRLRDITPSGLGNPPLLPGLRERSGSRIAPWKNATMPRLFLSALLSATVLSAQAVAAERPLMARGHDAIATKARA